MHVGSLPARPPWPVDLPPPPGLCSGSKLCQHDPSNGTECVRPATTGAQLARAPLSFFQSQFSPDSQDRFVSAIHSCGIWALYSLPSSPLLLLRPSPGVVITSRGLLLRRINRSRACTGKGAIRHNDSLPPAPHAVFAR